MNWPKIFKSDTGRYIIFFLLGLSLFLGIFIFIGPKILATLLKVNIFIYLLAIGTFAGVIVLFTLRWKFFIRSAGYDIPLQRLLPNFLIGLGINNITPIAKLGGEPVRAVLLEKREGIKMKEGLATITVDLVFEFITITLVILLSVFALTFFISPPAWLFFSSAIFLILAFLGIATVLGISSSKGFAYSIIDKLADHIDQIKKLRWRIRKSIRDFQSTFRKLVSKQKTIFFGFLYSSIAKLMQAIFYFLIFLSLGFIINPIHLIILIGLMGILLSIPATPGSLGIYEGGLTGGLTLLGIPPLIAASAVLLDRIVSYWLILLIGLVGSTYYGIKFTRFRKYFPFL